MNGMIFNSTEQNSADLLLPARATRESPLRNVEWQIFDFPQSLNVSKENEEFSFVVSIRGFQRGKKSKSSPFDAVFWLLFCRIAEKLQRPPDGAEKICPPLSQLR